MTLEQEIRTRLAAYLDGGLSLEDFDHWFAGATWDVRHSDPAAAELVYEVELLVAEFTSGHRFESELRDELRRVLQNYRIQLGPPPQRTSATSRTLEVKATLLPAAP